MSEPVPMWGGPCDSCDFIIVVDGDGKPVPDPVDWEEFPKCPVCGGTVHFDSQPETMWNRESRLIKSGIETYLTKVRTILLSDPKYGDIPPSVFEDLFVDLLGGDKAAIV